MASQRSGIFFSTVSLMKIDTNRGQLFTLLRQKAVVLRLEAGSTEAGFLAAFCPISNTPTLVIIQYAVGHILGWIWLITSFSNGQLREQLVSGVAKEDFVSRVRKALGAEDTS